MACGSQFSTYEFGSLVVLAENEGEGFNQLLQDDQSLAQVGSIVVVAVEMTAIQCGRVAAL